MTNTTFPNFKTTTCMSHMARTQELLIAKIWKALFQMKCWNSLTEHELLLCIINSNNGCHCHLFS